MVDCIPFKIYVMILLWSSFEYIKCGFVDKKCVNGDFVCVMQELKDCWAEKYRLPQIYQNT